MAGHAAAVGLLFSLLKGLPCSATMEPFRVTFEVQNLKGGGDGSFTVEVHPDWAPRGAARFAELVDKKFFDEARFFRVISGFMAQFGIAGDPAVNREWKDKMIQDDPVKAKNSRGRMTFATSGPNSRTTQLFVNFHDNLGLDGQGFAPFAEVVDGMEVVDKLYSGYGEGAPSGRGPSQSTINSQGNAYLKRHFPKLSYIKTVRAQSTLPTMQAFEEQAALAPVDRSATLALVLVAIVAVAGLSAIWAVFRRGSRTEGANTE